MKGKFSIQRNPSKTLMPRQLGQVTLAEAQECRGVLTWLSSSISRRCGGQLPGVRGSLQHIKLVSEAGACCMRDPVNTMKCWAILQLRTWQEEEFHHKVCYQLQHLLLARLSIPSGGC